MPSSPVVLPQDLADYKNNEPNLLIAQATAAVRNYCGWHVTPVQTDTVTLHAEGARSLLLPSLHVLDVSSVTVDGALVDPASYTWTPDGVLARRYAWDIYDSSLDYRDWRQDFLAGRRWWGLTTTVTFTHGFDQAADFAGVILAWVAVRQTAPKGITSQQVGPFAVQYGNHEETLDAVSILNSYRLPSRP